MAQEALDYVPDKDKETFDEILEQIEKKYNTGIYRLDEKYKNLEIFSNPTHIATETSQKYSNDLIELIERELEH